MSTTKFATKPTYKTYEILLRRLKHITVLFFKPVLMFLLILNTLLIYSVYPEAGFYLPRLNNQTNDIFGTTFSGLEGGY